MQRTARRRPRVISACLLLAVFFLPLHVHAGSTAASQVTKECVCLHGSRAQAWIAAAPLPCAFLFALVVVAPPAEAAPANSSIRIPSSRAPPRGVSL